MRLATLPLLGSHYYGLAILLMQAFTDLTSGCITETNPNDSQVAEQDVPVKTGDALCGLDGPLHCRGGSPPILLSHSGP